MLEDALAIPHALHAVLISADGLQMSRTADIGRDEADKVAAAVSGLQSLSRAVAFFCGDDSLNNWRQTLIEFDGGWVFLNAAGGGSFLAVAASADVDMGDITYRMQQLVGRLGKAMSTGRRDDTVSAHD
ncbi:roadblock/LC7 domain-containing protein [Streptomyces tsukubensis]|uniref:Dynein regulation protein LC7 n=1 Tax=Streptomyces tsukubensis TaxID=83656 RepID=A0A1V4A805_9ACTN|nr:roadblock/LC7 domain-containing protein [Streptomyces tsukubensis]OON78079.1 dynein regulation protein LC7 [Streptomyces tsukubensis]QFR98201.1 roadblock/LC7 domain-containing protein [Streptomyces tsukubensis]